MPDVYGKTVLITGAAGGFGRELTKQLLHCGSYLILTDYALPALHAAVQDIAHKLRAMHTVRGGIIGMVAADLATRTGCEQLYRQVSAITPAIDVLINNAGLGASGPFADTPTASWERMVAVNLLAPMRLTELFVPAMIARRTGHIVNMVSMAGHVASGSSATYATTKFGLRGFSEAIAEELAMHNIGVTAVYPFYTRTPILQSEHFGTTARQSLPDWMVGNPEQVIAELIAGVKANRRTVLPGGWAKQIARMQRFAPGSPTAISRLLSTGAKD